MNILSADHLVKNYTGRNLLQDTGFFLQEGEKVGLIGINGTGKSTLLKILAGIEETDAGERIQASHVKGIYLPQHPDMEGELTVEEYIGENHQAKSMLTRLGVTEFDSQVGHLSGGQKKRLALVKVLSQPADILFLDEPTNHLDHEMASWLESYLKSYRGAIVMITHDRYFLDSVVDRIVELDKGKLYSYEGNYSKYLELKAERYQYEVAAERKRQSILRTELAWVQRGARARSTKQKARLERFEELQNQRGPQEDQSVELSSISSRMGRTTVECEGIGKRFGNRNLIQDFTYAFLKQDRVGFIGRNGCGKTTLMKIIAGRETADTGTLTIGQTIKIGYYSQMIEEQNPKLPDGRTNLAYMDPKMKVIDYIRNTAEFVKTEEGSVSAAKMLERFLFPSDLQYSLIEKLSGGEKRRLNLLRVLMEAPNVLVMDEPTNDLDITTLTILEDYLDHFDGIVIIVSHDRYFLDRTVRRIWAFEESGHLTRYEGGYTYYEARREETTPHGNGNGNDLLTRSDSRESGFAATTKKSDSNATRGHEKKLKLSYSEQKEYDTIEQDIAALEEKIASLEQAILKAATDFVKLNELSKAKEDAEQELEHKMERWEYLEELVTKIKEQG